MAVRCGEKSVTWRKKNHFLEEVVGEKKKACSEGRGDQKASVHLCDVPLVAQAHIPVSYCVPESTQCHQQLLKDIFASTDPVVPALRLLQGRLALLAWGYSRELAGEFG